MRIAPEVVLRHCMAGHTSARPFQARHFLLPAVPSVLAACVALLWFQLAVLQSHWTVPVNAKTVNPWQPSTTDINSKARLCELRRTFCFCLKRL